MDVWFDSGSSWAYVGSLADSGRIFWGSLSMFGIKSLAYPKVEEELGSPVDLYLEGQDQHRGWLGPEKRCRLAAAAGLAGDFCTAKPQSAAMFALQVSVFSDHIGCCE